MVNFDWHGAIKDLREEGTVEALWSVLAAILPQVLPSVKYRSLLAKPLHSCGYVTSRRASNKETCSMHSPQRATGQHQHCLAASDLLAEDAFSLKLTSACSAAVRHVLRHAAAVQQLLSRGRAA